MTATLTSLARWAKRSVLIASSTFSFSPRSVTTIAALQLPPSESWSSRVSLLSRYGTRVAFVASAATTDESANSDWLIFFASSFRFASDDGPLSTAPDFFDDSIPARSHSVSRPAGAPSASVTWNANTPWPRLEREFIAIAATTRCLSPRVIAASTPSRFETGSRLRPSGTQATPPPAARTSRSVKFVALPSRSLTLSL